MAHVELSAQDLEPLKLWFPTLRFDREEQVKAILHMETADFQAVPGSGKTTLLGAKLALLSSKWPYANRGICVLSHTNVAKDEISGRLRSAPGGEALLGYPHYIGTIQTFVNKFIALPWLRHLDIDVSEIDDEAFGDRFEKRASGSFDIEPWVRVNSYKRMAAIRSARYRGPDLVLTSATDTALPVSGKCITRLTAIKHELARSGWLRHEDMFAYAEQALRDVPGLKEAIAHRFPVVFIDEMQDTSDIQLDVLDKVFGVESVVQRFGDVNQSVLRKGASSHPSVFPRAGFMEVAASLRFGQEIASVANCLKAVGGDMEGKGDVAVERPALCLYSDSTVEQVVARFASWVCSLFTQEDLDAHPVKAVCAVRTPGNSKQKVGRHLLDYFPAFDIDERRPSATRSSVCALVRDAGAGKSTPGGYAKRVASARLAVVRLLKACEPGRFGEIDSWSQLIRLLYVESQEIACVHALAHEVVTEQMDAADSLEWQIIVQRMIDSLQPVLPPGTVAPVADDLAFDDAKAIGESVKRNRLEREGSGRRVTVNLSSIAGVKGESHLATLILESCHNRRYDLTELLPYLTGKASAAGSTDEMRVSQLQNIFVGVTRAKRLLALAAHADRVDEATRAAMRTAGWQVVDWTS